MPSADSATFAAPAAPAPVLAAPAPAPTRRAFVAGSALAGLSAALAPGAFARAEAEAPADQVVVFHTNDVHGHLEGDGSSCVGMDLVAGLRDAVPGSLLVDAGDATQGMPVVSLGKGAAAVDVMNAARYDAMCLGNHEFDYGQDVLLDNARAAGFPLLGANVLKEEDGAPLLAGVGACGDGACAVVERAGRRIGLFGVVTAATPRSVTPGNVEGLAFADEVGTAEACIAELDARGVDAVVALCHLGGEPSVPCTAAQLASRLSPQAASRLAAIVDGHSHTVENAEVNGVLIVQTGCGLANLGKLTLTFGEGGEVRAEEELLDAAAVEAELAELGAGPDGEVSEELAAVSAEQDALMREGLFETPTTLWAGWLSGSAIAAPTRMVETNFGDVASEALAAAARAFLEGEGLASEPVVAVENGGGIREALARGAVSRGSLVAAFPFSNTVVLKEVTPALLREVLEASLSFMAGQDAATGMLLQAQVDGSFLQLAGCTVACNPAAEPGGRVTSVTLDGAQAPLDLDDAETPLVLASNSYVMAGGGPFGMLAEVPQLAEVGGELEAIQSYLEGLAGRGGATGPSGLPLLPSLGGTAGRLQMRGGYEPAPWAAAVRAVGADGQAVPWASLTVEVDAAERLDLVADGDGVVLVEVGDGPHALARVLGDGSAGPEVYVDNYMGIGLVEDELRSFPSMMVD